MISTHILDVSLGNPAKNVDVHLEKQTGNQWTLIAKDSTNDDGRISFNCKSEAGVYRLNFQIDKYFEKLNIKAFFKTTSVVFEISDVSRKYHVPLLLSPFGYSTYRGS